MILFEQPPEKAVQKFLYTREHFAPLLISSANVGNLKDRRHYVYTNYLTTLCIN